MPARIDVASTAACDLAPIDLAAAGAGLRLASYVWADQIERRQRLTQAISLAQQLGVQVELADAGAWVTRQLAASRPGRATVLYHSIVWQYLPGATQAALTLWPGGERRVLAEAHAHGLFSDWR